MEPLRKDNPPSLSRHLQHVLLTLDKGMRGAWGLRLKGYRQAGSRPFCPMIRETWKEVLHIAGGLVYLRSRCVPTSVQVRSSANPNSEHAHISRPHKLSWGVSLAVLLAPASIPFSPSTKGIQLVAPEALGASGCPQLLRDTSTPVQVGGSLSGALWPA